jgi:hypothetical protein
MQSLSRKTQFFTELNKIVQIEYKNVQKRVIFLSLSLREQRIIQNCLLRVTIVIESAKILTTTNYNYPSRPVF